MPLDSRGQEATMTVAGTEIGGNIPDNPWLVSANEVHVLGSETTQEAIDHSLNESNIPDLITFAITNGSESPNNSDAALRAVHQLSFWIQRNRRADDSLNPEIVLSRLNTLVAEQLDDEAPSNLDVVVEAYVRRSLELVQFSDYATAQGWQVNLGGNLLAQHGIDAFIRTQKGQVLSVCITSIESTQEHPSVFLYGSDIAAVPSSTVKSQIRTVLESVITNITSRNQIADRTRQVLTFIGNRRPHMIPRVAEMVFQDGRYTAGCFACQPILDLEESLDEALQISQPDSNSFILPIHISQNLETSSIPLELTGEQELALTTLLDLMKEDLFYETDVSIRQKIDAIILGALLQTNSSGLPVFDTPESIVAILSMSKISESLQTINELCGGTELSLTTSQLAAYSREMVASTNRQMKTILRSIDINLKTKIADLRRDSQNTDTLRTKLAEKIPLGHLIIEKAFEQVTGSLHQQFNVYDNLTLGEFAELMFASRFRNRTSDLSQIVRKLNLPEA